MKTILGTSSCFLLFAAALVATSYGIPSGWTNEQNFEAFKRLALERPNKPMVYSGLTYGVLLSVLMSDLPGNLRTKYQIKSEDSDIRRQCEVYKAANASEVDFNSEFGLDVPASRHDGRLNSLLKAVKSDSCVDVKNVARNVPYKFTGSVNLAFKPEAKFETFKTYEGSNIQVVEVVLKENVGSIFFVKSKEQKSSADLVKSLKWADLKTALSKTEDDKNSTIKVPAVNTDTKITKDNYVRWLDLQKYLDGPAVFRRRPLRVTQESKLVFPAQSQTGSNESATTFDMTNSVFILQDLKNGLELFTGVVV